MTAKLSLLSGITCLTFLAGSFLSTNVRAEENPSEEKPGLDITFDGPQSVSIDGKDIRISGPFQKAESGESGLAAGKAAEGLALPVSSFVGERGTILFNFLSRPVKPENSMVARPILTVRGVGREIILFYLLPNTDKMFFAFKEYTDTQSLTSRDNVTPDVWHQAACTWDGLWVRFYLDGVLQGEMPQPHSPSFDDRSRLYLGPFSDGSVDFASWNENSILFGSLQVFSVALSPGEILAKAGKSADGAENVPTVLAIPRVTEPPKVDGKLDDDAWKQGASWVTLIDGMQASESFAFPENNPRFCHDGQNLYVSLETRFPGSYNLKPGQAPQNEMIEVWQDESFEFFVSADNKLFRFAGNAAGGKIAMVDGGTFSGPWTSQSVVSTEIDNSRIWTVELAIPFTSLGLSGKEGEEFSINFCRTWRGDDRVAITSLAGTTHYDDQEKFAVVRLASGLPAFQQESINNPNLGFLEQKAKILPGTSSGWKYTVKALSSLDPVREAVLLEREGAGSGEAQTVEVRTALNSTLLDRLLFRLESTPDGSVLMEQMVPFKIVENYLRVSPVFGKSALFVKTHYELARGKAEGLPMKLQLLGSGEKPLAEVDVISSDEIKLPFDRSNPEGIYRIELVAGEGAARKVLSTEEFVYRGVGDWEKVEPADLSRVLAPFTPMTVQKTEAGLDVGVWGRTYHYQDSLLPSVTSSNDQVASSSALYVDGSPVRAVMAVTKETPARVELQGAVDEKKFDVKQESWIEYDGVLWNDLTLTAKQPVKDVEIKIAVPAALAKYYHAASGGYGDGGGKTGAVESNESFPFWPIFWIGNEEKGISWFAESHSTWKNAGAPLEIVREKDVTYLKVRLADQLEKGETLTAGFGLVASPVKPLPADYPFTMFGDEFPIHLNPPAPRAPITATCLRMNRRIDFEELGAGFYDLPASGPHPNPQMQWQIEGQELGKQHNVTILPYQAAIFLPEEYPEMQDHSREWQIMPERNLYYTHTPDDKQTKILYHCCPASGASDFYLWKFRELVRKAKLKGVYFDFGTAIACSNPYHGCSGGFHLLAKRNFYKRIAEILAEENNGDYTVVVHNSEAVQVPVFTFVTHFLNGEGLRQMSSSVYHFGKSLLDHYGKADFASEHSSLPWGITSSVYNPTDPLLPQFGGDQEDQPGQELYRFRMTKAAMAGTLVHNTIPSQSRNHYGLFDKVIRFYDDFGVNKAEFLPYWRNKDYVEVVEGKDICVSLYRHPEKKEILAVVSHLSKEHLDQKVTLRFHPQKFGWNKLASVTELMTGPDPEYDRLYAETNRLRNPVELGDFGVKLNGLQGDDVSLDLKHQSFGILKISGE